MAARVAFVVLSLSLRALAGEVPDASPPPNPPTEAARPSLEEIDRQLLSLRLDSALSARFSIASADRVTPVGLLFWDAELDEVFAAVPSALHLFQEGRRARSIGTWPLSKRERTSAELGTKEVSAGNCEGDPA